MKSFQEKAEQEILKNPSRKAEHGQHDKGNRLLEPMNRRRTYTSRDKDFCHTRDFEPIATFHSPSAVAANGATDRLHPRPHLIMARRLEVDCPPGRIFAIDSRLRVSGLWENEGNFCHTRRT